MFANVEWDISNEQLETSLLGTFDRKKKCKPSCRTKKGSIVKLSYGSSKHHKKTKNVQKETIGKDESVTEKEIEETILKEGVNKSRSSGSLSLLARKVAKKMSGARFRWINQKLYTCTGNDAAKMFTNEPHLFTVYHEGFREQADKWPLNPLDNLIGYIKGYPIDTVIADFGCGEARLAQSVSQKVHSFDFVSLNKHVTSCDMSHVPLDDSTVDIGVFCLSLMGVNLLDYLIEARRVIKLKGILKISEIQSRISSVDEFVSQVESLGFKLCKKMLLNKMFIDFEFLLKSKKKKENKGLNLELKPCLYKRR